MRWGSSSRRGDLDPQLEGSDECSAWNLHPSKNFTASNASSCFANPLASSTVVGDSKLLQHLFASFRALFCLCPPLLCPIILYSQTQAISRQFVCNHLQFLEAFVTVRYFYKLASYLQSWRRQAWLDHRFPWSWHMRALLASHRAFSWKCNLPWSSSKGS